MRIVVVPQEFDSIYYLPALKEALQVRGFRNVTVSNSNDVPINLFDLKIALDVHRQSTETTELVNDYGIIGTKTTPGDTRCKTTNNGLTIRTRCRSGESKTEPIWGYIGKKEEKNTTLTRSINLTFSNTVNNQIFVRAIGSSEESDWTCSNLGIFKFLIIHTVKRLDFTKPKNYDYRVVLPEGYSCETVDEYERSKNNGYAQKTGCVSGDCIGGEGTYTFPSGEKYVGHWKDDKRNGEGTLIYADGIKYVGLWKDDKRNGKGTMIYPDGHKYVGLWKDGKRNGEGTHTLPSGEKYVGHWKNGKLVKETDRLQN